jgi:hypothetical protein
MGLEKWAIEEPEGAFKISEENAEKCVKELLAFYHINVAKITNENLKTSASHALDILLDGYRRGALENSRNADGGMEVIQHIKDGKDKLVYRELEAKDKRVMDNYPVEAIFEKQQAVLGRLCGAGPDIIGKLKRLDLHIAEALSSIFFMG